jgi:hypothetical protein
MHTHPPRRRPVLWTLAAIALALAGGLSALAPSPQDPGSATLDTVTTWNDVDRLVSEQKFEAAAEAVGSIRERAQAAGDADEWTRALVEQTKLRIALHGYETAVRDLLAAEWPDDPTARAVLDLYTAHSLVTYGRAYSWEIRQRERVVSSDEVDLKKWTLDQIVAAAHQRLARVWSEREAWGATSIGELSRYIQQNSYPPRIRGTLRDAVTYLWVELLADTSLWRPEQSADVYRLDLPALLAGPEAQPDLDDPRVHPLDKIAFLTADLERWHAEARRPEAALEAFLERTRRLHDSFTRDDDRDTIREALAARLDAFDRSLPWWAAGRAELARMTQADDAPDALVRAHALALAGFERHPTTIGGQRCEHVVRSIEAPSYSVQGMAADGVGRSSLRVDHANLSAVWFRAYRYDLDDWFATSEDRNIFPSWQEVPTFLRDREPDVAWKVDLPPTPDYRSHATDAVPPINAPGAYVIVTSARSDFEAGGNQLTAVHLIVGDLVLVTRSVDGRWEVETRSGATGEPRPDVAVTLWRTDWRRGHYPVDRRASDRDGRVSFAHPGDGHTHFLIARSGDEVAVHAGSLYPHSESTPGTTTSSLISTDRAVYRPGQTLFYKVIAYSGGGEDASFRTLPGSTLTVRLRDGNREVVTEAELDTNDFGTASGSFDIPTGRLLGAWQLESSIGGATPVRVEEYKRPTFEVTLEAPAEALRLNRPAALDGEARYYFGLPVTDATVRWTVTREPVYPRWGWWWWRPPEAPRIIAAGDASLDAEGRFTVAFTPEADERRADETGLSYRFRVTAEVTDPGGETRTGSRGFRLGFVAVETRVDLERGFLRGGERAEVTVVRSDLDGTPRAGSSTWHLAALEQPDRTLTPAQQPLPPPRWPNAYQTEGDRTRPRWQPGYDPRAVLASWDAGRIVASGDLAHGDDGAAVATLPRLEPGAYRMTVETTDPFGADAVTTHDLVVARDRRTPLELPALLAVESDSVPVGGTARLFVRSGFDHQRIVLELQRGGRRIERRVLVAGRDDEIVEIPITGELRGGFGVVMTVLRDHQLVTQSASVMVPWDDKRLDVAFATFRDRLRPGDSETFRVSVRAPDDETLAAGAVELLASMYDRSLDLFAVHSPPDPLGLYPTWTWVRGPDSTLGQAPQLWSDGTGLASVPPWPWLQPDALIQPSGYGIGGPGRRGMVGGVYAEEGAAYRMTAKAQIASDAVAEAAPMPASVANEREAKTDKDAVEAAETAPELRTDFSETAFFSPHLLLDADGGVDIEFTVPDSVTEWTFWVQAVTRDLEAGSSKRNLKTVKELMVRPAVPRFLREGDLAELAVVVNNAGDEPLEGTLDLRILDPADDSDLGDAFALADATGVPFAVESGGSATLTFPIAVPPRPGLVAFEAVARAGAFSDGERRPLPVLPGRMHLIQSRFAALRDADSR